MLLELWPFCFLATTLLDLSIRFRFDSVQYAQTL